MSIKAGPSIHPSIYLAKGCRNRFPMLQQLSVSLLSFCRCILMHTHVPGSNQTAEKKMFSVEYPPIHLSSERMQTLFPVLQQLSVSLRFFCRCILMHTHVPGRNQTVGKRVFSVECTSCVPFTCLEQLSYQVLKACCGAGTVLDVAIIKRSSLPSQILAQPWFYTILVLSIHVVLE